MTFSHRNKTVDAFMGFIYSGSMYVSIYYVSDTYKKS